MKCPRWPRFLILLTQKFWTRTRGNTSSRANVSVSPTPSKGSLRKPLFFVFLHVCCPGNEHKTKAEQGNAPDKFKVVSFPVYHPQESLRGKVYVQTTALEKRRGAIGEHSSTTALRGLKDKIASMARDQIPTSIITSQLPTLAREICASAGIDFESTKPERYLLSPAQVHDIVREQKRAVMEYNVGDLAQTEALVQKVQSTHFVRYTPLMFSGRRGGPVEQHFQLMFMDKQDAAVLRRRGSQIVYLDATYKVNEVSCLPLFALVCPCSPFLPLVV